MNIHSNYDPAQALQNSVQSLRSSSTVSEAAISKAVASSGHGQPVIEDGDTANISATAAVLSTSDVRSEKVAAIQLALVNGTYSVSPSELAGKLINHMLQD
jgi:negative regulator of flagellin synthesis FlgM